jgi:hypothetical protein
VLSFFLEGNQHRICSEDARNGRVGMFVVFFSILPILALLMACTEVIMRVRLSQRESSANRLLWWRLGGDEVDGTYQEVLPHTLLLRIRRYLFWLFIVCCVAPLASFILNRI